MEREAAEAKRNPQRQVDVPFGGQLPQEIESRCRPLPELGPEQHYEIDALRQGWSWTVAADGVETAYDG